MNRVISRIRRPTTILVSVIFAVGFAFAQRPSVSDDEKAVRDVLMRGATSFEKNDTAEATKVWVNDESLTVFESGHIDLIEAIEDVVEDIHHCVHEYVHGDKMKHDHYEKSTVMVLHLELLSNVHVMLSTIITKQAN